MKIAIFTILVISMGIMILASPEAHAIDSGISHAIGDIDHQLNGNEIYNNTHVGQTLNHSSNIKSMQLDMDNSLLDTYLT